MKKQPSFSIITVCYNAEKTIETTLKSVSNQTYDLIEYIVIDGSSNDKTLEIISKYKENVNHLLSESDQGLYDAMNKGMHLATGNYLIFLNAGDTFYSSTTLEEVVNGLDQEKELPDIIYGETALVDIKGKYIRMRRLRSPEALNWESFKQGMLVCHQAFWVRRSLATDYDLKYNYSSDFDWCIRCMQKTENIYNSHRTLINYLEDESGITAKNTSKSLYERFKIMSHYYPRYEVILFHFWFAQRYCKSKFIKSDDTDS